MIAAHLLGAALAVGQPGPVPNPYASDVLAALADAKKLAPEVAARTRYLSLHGIAEPRQADAVKAADFWANSLSREAEVKRLRRVGKSLLAAVLDDYTWDPKVWDKLADVDPYYHVVTVTKVRTGKTLPWRGGVWNDGVSYPAGSFQVFETKEAKVSVSAPWLPVVETAALIALTQTPAPVVRLDWWFSQTAIQAGRDGVGYYDWFGNLKEEKDYQKLVALDVKESQRVKKEVAGIVARSGVANLPRQIFRFSAVTGGYWETRDVLDDNKDARNALRNLDGTYKFQAKELYAFLPNGLYVYYLSDDKGVRQDSAPDKIGSDDTAPGRDKRIHVGLSCVRCHIEGLRPINDWARRVFTGPLKLASPDAEQTRRLQQLYLGELQESVDDDVRIFTRAVKRANGLTTQENAKVLGQVWEHYVEADLSPADLAKELGLTEAAYLQKLRAAFAANPLADPVLASHIATPPVPLRRDDVEQLYPLIAPTVLGTLLPAPAPAKEK